VDFGGSRHHPYRGGTNRRGVSHSVSNQKKSKEIKNIKTTIS
jgi:hypothetical protein